MKKYNLLIQDKDEKEWNNFVKIKIEKNLDEAIINLIKKHIYIEVGSNH